MRQKINRRDFLKVAGLLSGGMLLPSFLQEMPSIPYARQGKKNILIVVFDAFSAHNISLYGYGRNTTPNLDRWAQRAVVYHNHLATANFTTPGTASLLTGSYPWTHQAIQLNADVDRSFQSQNLFDAFDDYHRVAYSHNPFANSLFRQFQDALDEFIPIERLLLTDDGLIQSLFRKDSDISGISWARAIKQNENGGYSYSLFLPGIYNLNRERRISSLRDSFPLGLPYIQVDNYFILEQAIDFTKDQLSSLPAPFLGYYHFIPPHSPYRTRDAFFDRFKDDAYQAPLKPKHLFGGRNRTPEFLTRMRKDYDEYILYVDHEFNRLMDFLDHSGILNDTWVIFTSDHGELFERAFWGHSAPVLYQPVIRIPLLIFEPGRTDRLDVYSPTSAVDLLPTLLHVTAHPPATWSEGSVLPPFGNQALESNRSIYAFESRNARPHESLKSAVVTLVKGPYKLIYTFGYPQLLGSELVELYDIESDSEELEDLSTTLTQIRDDLLDELRLKIIDINRTVSG